MTVSEKKVVNEQKVKKVKELAEKVKKATSIVFVDYKGISVAGDTELRKNARSKNVEYLVAKNRLFKLALKDAGIEENFDDTLKESTSFAFSYEDAVSPAKVMYEFGKDKEFFNIKAGILEGKKISAQEVEELAKLPSREVLISRLLGSLNSPISGLANVLNGNLRNLVYVLSQVQGQKA